MKSNNPQYMNSPRYEEFVSAAAERGHFRERAAIAGAALAETHCRADLANREQLIRVVVEEARRYFHEVLGWPASEAKAAADLILQSALTLSQRDKLVKGVR